MAYDVESDRIILFGGFAAKSPQDPKPLNDETWAYDVSVNTWTNMEPPVGPSMRDVAELVYDAESDRVILFGGRLFDEDKGIVLNDTWAYDYNSNTWTQMADGPADHLSAQMAYDTESDRVILFGGIDIELGTSKKDTWAYDFNSDTWTEMNPVIKPRSYRSASGVAYDSKSDRVLMWSGASLSVWSYDFNTNIWQEIETGEGPHPSNRSASDMVYDAESDRMILFGGTIGGDETWSYDNKTNTWTKMGPDENPGELIFHAMVYSVAADRVILFGGKIGNVPYKYSGETWSYDLNTDTWENVTPLP
jgi:N-acetylneuraminic acid mutarotase